MPLCKPISLSSSARKRSKKYRLVACENHRVRPSSNFASTVTDEGNRSSSVDMEMAFVSEAWPFRCGCRSIEINGGTYERLRQLNFREKSSPRQAKSAYRSARTYNGASSIVAHFFDALFVCPTFLLSLTAAYLLFDLHRANGQDTYDRVGSSARAGCNCNLL